eukprot:gene28766-37108_t
MSAGGGSKRLYRKVGDRSSTFYPNENDLRKEGSYIYEEFVNTQGTDVKVYTVGPDYSHAEARKSPVVDGKVNRDTTGVEIRYPVMLSNVEKEISRKIVLGFKQNICGFDILRVQERSYVCDVNGFSFVKNSRKYYDDCAQILTDMFVSGCRPNQRAPNHISKSKQMFRPLTRPLASATSTVASLSPHGPVVASEMDSPDRSSSPAASSILSEGDQLGAYDREVMSEELRCVIAIVRHGDRTPKQKMKV